MNTMTGRIVAIAIIASSSQAAIAKTVSVEVDAKSGPWSGQANAKMPFGRDPRAPTVVELPDTYGKVAIYADGTTIAGANGPVGPAGVEGRAVDDTKGPNGKVYPSLYTPKILYPANLHALIGVFVDAAGKIVGRPFVVGGGVRVTTPDDAKALALGFNDVDFATNTGALKVTIELPDD